METGVAGDTSLRERLAAAPSHSGTAFDTHLEATAALLRAWGARRALELAGRYHSVYGNPHGRLALASREARELIPIIGAEAERLVWLWAELDRGSLARPAEIALVSGERIAVSGQVHADLIHLHAANELEQATRTGVDCRLLEPLRPWLCRAALDALERQRAVGRPAPSWLAKRYRRLARRSARLFGAR